MVCVIGIIVPMLKAASIPLISRLEGRAIDQQDLRKLSAPFGAEAVYSVQSQCIEVESEWLNLTGRAAAGRTNGIAVCPRHRPASRA
jgi:hypothetical protein